MSETLTETEIEVSKEFFTAFGAAVFAGCQLQYSLAAMNAVAFETVRDGSRQRVEEKIRAALITSFGKAVGMAKENRSLDGELLAEVEFAWELRDYIVHRLFLGTRSQQNERGFPGLTERLYQAFALFKYVEGHVREKYKRSLLDAGRARGIPEEVFDAGHRAWDELEDRPIEPYRHAPARYEQIVAVWNAPSLAGPLIVLQSNAGVFWLIADTGLAHFDAQKEDTWTENAEIAAHLPASVRSRPPANSNPPEYRGAFDYDLALGSGGAILRISRRDSETLDYQVIVPAKGGGK